MSQNKLLDLPSKVFSHDGMRHLQILDLADNELSTLSDDVFNGYSDLSDLRSLRLEGNRLRRLGDPWLLRLGISLFHLHRLEELHLQQNQLQRLHSGDFRGLRCLEELNLQQNQLTDLDEDVFDDDWNDRSLKWSLLKLNLGGNRLTTLPDGLFNCFRKLRNLQLQSNQLVRLPQQLFQTLGEVHWAFLEFPRDHFTLP